MTVDSGKPRFCSSVLDLDTHMPSSCTRWGRRTRVGALSGTSFCPGTFALPLSPTSVEAGIHAARDEQ